jgi:hypothetical protein
MLCATRAQKNLHWLRNNAPEAFLEPEPEGGWESVIPVQVLTRLNRSIPDRFDGPADLSRLKSITFPSVRARATEPLFAGTIYFVRITFTIDPWALNDLTLSVPGPPVPAAAGSALTSWADANFQHVIFLDGSQHVRELYYPLS